MSKSLSTDQHSSMSFSAFSDERPDMSCRAFSSSSRSLRGRSKLPPYGHDSLNIASATDPDAMAIQAQNAVARGKVANVTAFAFVSATWFPRSG